jgi:hypothetical protein
MEMNFQNSAAHSQLEDFNGKVKRIFFVEKEVEIPTEYCFSTLLRGNKTLMSFFLS